MYYALNGFEITMIDDALKINIVQSKDPTHQKYFESEQEAIDWAKQYTFKILEVSDTISFDTIIIKDIVGVDIPNPMQYEKATITLTETSGQLNGDYEIEFCHMTEHIKEKVMFSFVDGVATQTYVFKETGEYRIRLDGTFDVDGKKCVVFELENKFDIIVK